VSVAGGSNPDGWLFSWHKIRWKSNYAVYLSSPLAQPHMAHCHTNEICLILKQISAHYI